MHRPAIDQTAGSNGYARRDKGGAQSHRARRRAAQIRARILGARHGADQGRVHARNQGSTQLADGHRTEACADCEAEMTDNTMRIWDAVCKTNPANTKQVNQRGGFTAINANSQIMEATRQFGPIGIGWGYIAGEPIFHDKLVIVPVTLWHGDRNNTFGPVFGCEEWIVKDRVDSDAPKKAGTDGLTKLLSQLGFNAD